MSNAKIFVLDTNVILHDHKCIYNFEDNDVVIPIIVLEELDRFKKGNDQINFQARQFVRILDELVGDDLFNGGLSLGQGKGKLKIETGQAVNSKSKEVFQDNIPDHRILSTAELIMEHFSDRKTVLVTKDVNLRMKAKSLGIEAEDYKNDKIVDLKSIYDHIRTLENFDDELIDRLYEKQVIPIEDVEMSPAPAANECFILKGGRSSVLAIYDPQRRTLSRVDKASAFGIKPRNAEQTFSMNVLLNPEVKLAALTGKAGTGKTLLALAAAIAQHGTYDQILLARPIVSLSNREIGYLPGDAEEKISPYMQPLFDNLAVIKRCFDLRSSEYQMIDELLKNKRLIITPLAYIRGRSLSNSFFIIDEAQNLTPHEVKTIITRAGEGTKMIFTGDIMQIDSPYLDIYSNGLANLIEKMQGQDLFAHINLVNGERSYLAELASDLL